ANALPDAESAPSHVAGKDQLQPLSVAAAIRLRRTSQALVFCILCAGTGRRFVLSGRAAAVADSGEESAAAEAGSCIGAGSVKIAERWQTNQLNVAGF